MISWEILQEKKNIGGYQVQKAISTIGGSTVTAWYASTLPVGNGPKDLWGLPGLILEVGFEDNSFIVAKEITRNAGIKTEQPSKGKQVTEEEFQALKKDYAENLEKMYGGREGTTVIKN